MNCERCSELLVEYMDGGLGPEERAAVAEHLSGCEECAREMEEYSEIRRVVTEESPLPAPSDEIMARLSKAARDSVSREKRPFWKRRPYSPILIPVLSSAIAIMVWFYYGHGRVDVMDTASRDVLASKVKEPAGNAGQAMPEMRKEYSSAAKSSPALGENVASDEGRAAAPAAPPIEETYSLSDQAPGREADSEREEKALPATAMNKTEQARSQASTADAAKDYAGILRLALKQQTEGDCEASIKTNELLLRSDPEPPGDLRAQSYRSLAECYEKEGKLDLAVAYYTHLGEVSPADSPLAESRISAIKQRSLQKMGIASPTPRPVE